MRIFVDYHHDDLYYSLILLFEKRLGWEVYRPIGLEWFEKGYWRIAEPYGNAMGTVNQYLAIGDKTWDAYKNLNGNYSLENGIYNVYNPVHDYHHKAITYEKFLELKPDIVISSIPAHDESFARLISDLDYRPKHISHVGNVGQRSRIRNIMCAAANLPDVHPATNIIYYHQEFDLSVYKYIKPYHNTSITCLMNVLPQTPDYSMYLDMKQKMPDFTFKSYGGSCDNGSLHSAYEIAKVIQDSSFMWHLKHTGDGFGHVIHQAFACGRPPIVNKSYYAGQLAEALMIDGQTCICVDGKTTDKIEEEIKYYSNLFRLTQMSENAYKRFTEVCNYDKESEKIKEFIANLI